MDTNTLKFPCVEKGSKYVTVDECKLCKINDRCDIYPTMLEEEYERKKEEGN